MWYNFHYNTTTGVGGETKYLYVSEVIGLAEKDDIITGVMEEQSQIIGIIEKEDIVIGNIVPDEIEGIIEEDEQIKGKEPCQ